MTIPTGSGSEVLRRNSIYNQDITATQIDWAQAIQTAAGNSSGTVAVPANVIITILTVFFANRSGGSEWVDMSVVNSGASGIRFLVEHTLADTQTFVWNDKFVLRENDKLQFDASGNDMDIHLSYIYQDWT